MGGCRPGDGSGNPFHSIGGKIAWRAHAAHRARSGDRALPRRPRNRRGDAEPRRAALDRPAVEWLVDTGERLSAADGERIVRLVAHHVGAEVHAGAPRVSAELPETGERFEGLLPPVVAAPAFAIRKPAVAVFTLDDYVAAGIMPSGQAAILRAAVADAATSLSPAAPRPARRRSPTRCWPRSPRPPIASC